jgi:hypothetical protein
MYVHVSEYGPRYLGLLSAFFAQALDADLDARLVSQVQYRWRPMGKELSKQSRAPEREKEKNIFPVCNRKQNRNTTNVCTKAMAYRTYIKKKGKKERERQRHGFLQSVNENH